MLTKYEIEEEPEENTEKIELKGLPNINIISQSVQHVIDAVTDLQNRASTITSSVPYVTRAELTQHIPTIDYGISLHETEQLFEEYIDRDIPF